MKTVALIGVSTFLLVANPSASRADFGGGPISDDASLDAAQREYRGPAAAQAPWHNPHLPRSMAPLSGNQQLMQIVGEYTRAVLDRGGWVNSLMRNSQYASGNPLLAVQNGEGVIIPGLSTGA